MERNRKMFYKIASIIEDQPDLHDQTTWFGNIETWDKEEVEQAVHVVVDGKEFDCGTTQCIAGWAIVLDNRLDGFFYDGVKGVALIEGRELDSNTDYIALGQEILGLSTTEANRLFMNTATDDISDWPAFLRALGDNEDFEEARDRFQTSRTGFWVGE